MKDGLKRTLSVILGAIGIAYIGWMMAQQQTFVVDALLPYQMIIGVGFIVFFALFIFALGLKPVAVKRLKWWVVLYAIVLIFLGNYMLIDNAAQWVFAGDLVTILGVIIFFLGLAGVLLTKKVKQEVEKAMQEIIEV